MTELRVPRETLIRGIVAAAVVALILLPWPREAIGGAWRAASEPPVTADAETLALQRDAAERAVARAHAAAVDQLRRARQLQLAITRERADEIETKAHADLRSLRRNAFTLIAQALGLSGDASQRYIGEAEARSDAAQPVGDPNVLLAPSLTTVAGRTAQLARSIADDATRALTSAPR